MKEVVLHLPEAHLRHISYIIIHTVWTSSRAAGQGKLGTECTSSLQFYTDVDVIYRQRSLSTSRACHLKKCIYWGWGKKIDNKFTGFLPVACCLISTHILTAAGLLDLLEQRGSRSSEWHRGVQIPVCLGPLELPRESTAAVHAQQPAQRWVQSTHRATGLDWLRLQHI